MRIKGIMSIDHSPSVDKRVAFFVVRHAWRVARKRHLIGCGG
jgi:hypothetical protein